MPVRNCAGLTRLPACHVPTCSFADWVVIILSITGRKVEYCRCHMTSAWPAKSGYRCQYVLATIERDKAVPRWCNIDWRIVEGWNARHPQTVVIHFRSKGGMCKRRMNVQILICPSTTTVLSMMRIPVHFLLNYIILHEPNSFFLTFCGDYSDQIWIRSCQSQCGHSCKRTADKSRYFTCDSFERVARNRKSPCPFIPAIANRAINLYSFLAMRILIKYDYIEDCMFITAVSNGMRVTLCFLVSR